MLGASTMMLPFLPVSHFRRLAPVYLLAVLSLLVHVAQDAAPYIHLRDDSDELCVGRTPVPGPIAVSEGGGCCDQGWMEHVPVSASETQSLSLGGRERRPKSTVATGPYTCLPSSFHPVCVGPRCLQSHTAKASSLPVPSRDRARQHAQGPSDSVHHREGEKGVFFL